MTELRRARTCAVLAAFVVAGFLLSQVWDVCACDLPKGAAEKAGALKPKGEAKGIQGLPPVGVLGISLPSGVSQVSGFPRASSTWCCGAALFCQIDDADVTQEVLMPCTAESLEFACSQIHRCCDSIWVVKSGGVNAKDFPVTISGHPCSCLAVADIDADSKPEIVIGSDINTPSSAKNPDSRVYVLNSDGTTLSGFPKDVERGPIPGGICLVDLDSWAEGGDNAAEILFGTRGWQGESAPDAGKITALNADGSYVASWNKLPDDYQVVNSPAVGNLLDDGQNFPGNEVVFVVQRFYIPQGQVSYTYESRVIAFKRDGTQLSTYDLGDVQSYAAGNASSPAIGKILTYENSDIESNIVVCSRANKGASPANGKIWVLHLVPNGNSATITLDWSYETTTQDCETVEDVDVPDEFRADPVIADLDNDSQNEIVAYSAQGTLCVVDRVNNQFVVSAAATIECGRSLLRDASPLVWDLDASHSTLEIVVCNRASDPERASERSVLIYQYNGSTRELTELYEIGPFEADIEMTPALGDIDGDDKTDIILQPLTGGLIYCLEFDNSDYDSTMNLKGWPCMGRNAARTHCAD